MGAPVDWLTDSERRSVASKAGSARIRLYCTGTSMVWVTRSRAAISRKRVASNLRIRMHSPPWASEPISGVIVVFEYIGVDSSTRLAGPKPKPLRRDWRLRMPCRCTMPLGVPVVPEL